MSIRWVCHTVLAAVVVSLACVNFESVKIVGTAAQKLPQAVSPLLELRSDCAAFRTVQNMDTSGCANYAEASSDLKAMSDGLAAYGEKLVAIVDERDVDHSARVAALLSSGASAGWYDKLSTSTTNEAKSIAKDIVSVLSLEYRKEEVAKAVSKTKDSIASASAALSGSATLMRKQLTDDITVLDGLMRAERDGPKRQVLNQLVEKLTDQQTQLGTLLKMVEAFQNAHAKLLKSDGSFDRDSLDAVVKVFEVAFGKGAGGGAGSSSNSQ